jgi:hypothetical protein
LFECLLVELKRCVLGQAELLADRAERNTADAQLPFGTLEVLPRQTA